MNNMSLTESDGSATASAFAKETPNLWDLQAISSILYPRFTILKPLDESNDGATFLARDEIAGAAGNDLLVKLKVISDHAQFDREKLELFYLETCAAAELSHKNIIKTSEAERIGDLHFCAIEHKPDCKSLRSLLELRAWLDVQLATVITLQIAEALDYAYGRGVMHLNLRPENILIDPEGNVLVTDFGVGTGDESRWARRGRAQKMPAFYCSPEQANGQDVDARSDLYSLGIILYEMLTDRVPFDYQNSNLILHKHKTQMPEPPDVFRSDLPAAVSAVVMSLLEKRPSNRPQTPAHLQFALNRIIQKQDAAEINTAESVLDLGIDDDIIPVGVVNEDKTVSLFNGEPLTIESNLSPSDVNEPLTDWDDFAPPEKALVLKPVARGQREKFEPPTITFIEPPLYEFVEHTPVIETSVIETSVIETSVIETSVFEATAKVITSHQESPVVRGQGAPKDIRTKLFLVLLIIIAAALALTLFDHSDSSMPFRKQTQPDSIPEEATKEDSQPAKPGSKAVEASTPLDSSTRSEKSELNRPGKIQTSGRVQGAAVHYSRQKPAVRAAQRKFKNSAAVRPVRRARVRGRWN